MLGLLCFLLVLKLAATLYSGSLDLCITWDNKFKPKGHRDCVDDKADMSGKKREEQVGALPTPGSETRGVTQVLAEVHPGPVLPGLKENDEVIYVCAKDLLS